MVGVQDLTQKSKTSGDSIKNLPNPQNFPLALRRSLFGSIIEYIKFVPNLSTLSSPLPPIFEQKLVNYWNDSDTKAFEELKNQIVNITEKILFDIRRNSRPKTDASHNSLGATLEQ